MDNCAPGFQEVSLGRAKSLQERQSVWQKDKGMLIHYKAVLLLHKHIFVQVVTYFECLSPKVMVVNFQMPVVHVFLF